MRWSPDGSALAFASRVPEPGRYGTAAGPAHLRGPDAEPPRLITAPAHRVDGVGHLTDRRHHAFVLDVTAATSGSPVNGTASAGSTGSAELPAPRQVTDGDADDTEPTWTADGATLLVLSARHDGAGHDLRRGVHRVDATAERASALEPVVGGDLAVGALALDPDGRRLWLLATSLDERGLGAVAQPESLWTGLLPAPGSAALDPGSAGSAGSLERLTEPDVDLGDPAGSLVVDGRGALVAERSRGALRLLRVRPDGSREVLLDGHLQATAVASTPDGATTVAVVADGTSRGELVLVSPAGPVRLTDVGGPLRATGRLRPLLEVEHPSRDGHPVHGWVVLPDPERHGAGPHPVLLLVHGGPHAQYGWGLFDEAQVAAGAGYAVVMGNPRGSAGYGLAHGEAVLGALGTVDADDVVALLDGALADASLPLDAARVGVMGGSYGGYMTALLTTRTQRFAAAVVERGYLDATSFVGSADIGWYFPDQLHGSEEAMRAQSPMSHVSTVRTPTLVVHSEHDWRCPVEQGQRWWTALRRQGVESALLLFPGEGHELTRSGRPSHRVARFEHLQRWWDRHLPV